MEIKPDDLVLCTVRKIEGTAVFVDIEGNGEGSIVLSEVAAGRIRNIREYVFPNKKIVCKVLKVSKDHIELSYRRVTAKERDMVLERSQKERTFRSILKAITEDYEKILEKIKKESEISDFFDECREKPELMGKFLEKKELDKFKEIISEKKEKEKEVKKFFSLKSYNSSGLNDIKSILSDLEKIEIKYLGSGKFVIYSKASDFKEAEKSISISLEKIERKAKEKKAFIEIKEK